jgi:hypothetical protein
MPKKRLISRYNQFRDRAIEVMNGIGISEPLRSKVAYAVKTDDSLKGAVAAHFAPPAEGAPAQSAEEKAAAVIQLVCDKVSDALTDATLPGRQKYVAAIIRQLVDDAVLKKLLS